MSVATYCHKILVYLTIFSAPFASINPDNHQTGQTVDADGHQPVRRDEIKIEQEVYWIFWQPVCCLWLICLWLALRLLFSFGFQKSLLKAWTSAKHFPQSWFSGKLPWKVTHLGGNHFPLNHDYGRKSTQCTYKSQSFYMGIEGHAAPTGNKAFLGDY